MVIYLTKTRIEALGGTRIDITDFKPSFQFYKDIADEVSGLTTKSLTYVINISQANFSKIINFQGH